MNIKPIIFFSFSLFLCPLWSQNVDTAAINAACLRAHQIHEDSATLARQLCFEILKASAKSAYLKGQGEAYVTLGAISRNNREFQDSYDFLYQALKIRRAIGDSNRVAAVYINLAINMLEESRYDSAIATALYAIKIVEVLPHPDYAVLGSTYLLLSNIYDEYLEPDDALKYAKVSLTAYKKTDQGELIGKAAYALANRFLESGDYDSALMYYDQAYKHFMVSTQDPRFLSDIMTNKGIVYTQKGDFSLAGELYQNAQIILDQMGENADYFHLYLNKGNWLISQKDWVSGLEMLKKALPKETTDLSYLDQLYLYDNLADAYAALQISDSAYYYQKAAYSVRDSIYNEHKRKEFIRFQTERYKNEYAQQEIVAHRQASRARLFLQTSLLLLLLLLLIAYIYIQRKRAFNLIQVQQEKLHRQEVDELIQNSELRYLNAGLEGREIEKEQIARELHDQLGSAIVTLSWQYDAILENTELTSGNYHPLLKLNDTLKQLYQDIRHIAHQLGSGVLERAGLVPVLQELCQNIELGKRMEVNFSCFGMDSRLGFSYEINILRIIQELISNVLKYAKATQLMVQINRIGDTVNIMIEDDGIGFDHKLVLINSGGAGLNNIEARLRSLNGTIQFENRPLGGTTVIINILIPKPETFYEQTY